MAKHKNSTPTKSKVHHARIYGDSPEYPIFSFRYLTSNKNYSLAYFKKDGDGKGVAYALFEKLVESSSHKISELLCWNKERGFETVPHSHFYHRISIAARPLPHDTKLYVLRFNNQNSRLVCFKDLEFPNLFYIVAFDFNYSLYSHG
jgi:hypothetical protein